MNARPVLLLRGLLFWALFAPSVVFYATLAILMLPLPYLWRYRVVGTWAALVLWWLRVTCGIRHEVRGRENIPKGPAIVMSKHQSTWETIALQRIFPPQVWVLKKELLYVPFFGWALMALEGIAIDRGAGRRAVVELVRQGKQRLDTGRWVVIFPEGTRTRPCQRPRYKIGGAVLAAKTGYPVVPVAHNAAEHWPKKPVIKYPGTIRVSIGPVIETRGRKAEEILAEVEAWIEGEMPHVLEHPCPQETQDAQDEQASSVEAQ